VEQPTQASPASQRRHRPLSLAAAMAFAAFAMFVAYHLDVGGPVVLVWLPALISAAVALRYLRRTARMSCLPDVARVYWRAVTVAVGLVGAGAAISAADTVLHGGLSVQPPSVPSLACYTLAMLVLLWGLYRIPVNARTSGERLRVWLDAATVALGSATFMWHYLAHHDAHTDVHSSGDEHVELWTLALALTGIGAVAKLALPNDGVINRRSLRLLAMALVAGSAGTVPHRLVLDDPPLNAIVYVIPVVLFFVVWSAEQQRRAGPSTAVASRRNPFSVLPYLAVVAVNSLLLSLVAAGDTDHLLPVALGAVLLTGLVVVRQLTAYWENRNLLHRLEYGATHDALTELPNRAYFAERLRHALATSNGRPLSVALIDLDSFKIINDTLGHNAGDALLVAVGRRLAANVTPRDTVARLGGDEFVVVLDGTDPTGADIAVRRILDGLSVPFWADGHELLVSASIGIADGRNGDNASELLRQADVAMYAAKRQGGAGHLHYRHDMGGSSADHAHLGAELRQALGTDQLFLLYQPLVSLDDSAMVGVEALVRWQHPERGLISPADFIPLAERTGLIIPLGRWVLAQACRQAVAWTERYGDAAPQVINVNVSGRELREPNFPDHVAAILADTGLPPHRLVLEITETTVLALGSSVTNLHTLRATGIRIALDDFGTGQSTLTLLHDCPVDELKLDRSFTQSDTVDRRDTMAVAVIQLAQALGLETVAEGVETAQQADRLRALGYHVVQGFFFARPLSVEQIDGELATAMTSAVTAD
jgi:diguanylate cyclase (GGDEF)-like protein